ncbi:glucoside xylosyltransferase 1-like [Actinia tenebrosa]|uniref:UDP-D-xylose:beta-D-glucoside alpha-1,3-D-xylosyltransferase n=1 Tax=Actinia tenebrosa TaxID=6105 RepID=A0A6P8JCI7_ACTTE|nr:glucoside xylosyltransferase 1-like [Actinia tenebrosa]
MRIISKIILLAICVIVFFEISLLWMFSGENLISSPTKRNQQFDSTVAASHKEIISSINTAASFVQSYEPSYIQPQAQLIHVAVVVCGERTEEATTMLKSVTLFTKRQLYFHILAEDEHHDKIKSIINVWPCTDDGQVVYKVYSLEFPSGKSSGEWKSLFKPCAAQRLFLPSVLKNIDSLIYMDTDCLVLRPIEDVWQHFSDFNSTQLAAVSPEGEVPGLNWYKRFARHPYYGQLGINSGVMLMNLTRMRSHDWVENMLAIYKKYKLDITWGDQDILNIFFHFHPELLYVFNCEWNLRPDHCMYGSNCKTAQTNGISVLHGNRGAFHGTKWPVFKAVYDAINEYHHGDDGIAALESLREELGKFDQTYCGALKDAILKHPWTISNRL